MRRLNIYKQVRNCNVCSNARSKVLVYRMGTLDLREMNFRAILRAILWVTQDIKRCLATCLYLNSGMSRHPGVARSQASFHRESEPRCVCQAAPL